MGLNDIQLPEFLISEWYSDNMLVPSAGSHPTSPANTPIPSAPSTPPAVPSAAYPPPPTPAARPTPPASPAPSTPPSTPSSTAPTAPPLSSPSEPPPPGTIRHLGNNRRNITLLVRSPASPFLPDNQLAFLTKILEACRMTLADVAIVNIATSPVTIGEIRQQLHPATVLLFGVEPTALRLPINFPAFRPQDYDGCTYLSAPGLDHLVPNTEESKLSKSKLWVCLKTIFSV